MEDVCVCPEQTEEEEGRGGGGQLEEDAEQTIQADGQH